MPQQHPHARNPLSIEQIAELTETIYEGITKLCCSLQVFEPLQKAAIQDENYPNLEALELLHRDLLQKVETLDEQAFQLRKAVDPKAFQAAFMKRLCKIMDGELPPEGTDHPYRYNWSGQQEGGQ